MYDGPFQVSWIYDAWSVIGHFQNNLTYEQDELHQDDLKEKRKG